MPNIIDKILGKGDEKDSASSESSSTRGDASSTGKSATNTGVTESSSATSGSVGSGDYSTSDRTTAPAVLKEKVINSNEEQVQQVVDRERHQDHHHTTVQPVTDRQVAPEQHTQRQAETQYREFDHGDAGKTQERLAAEQSQFQNTRTEGATTQTYSQAPTSTSEHVHHHMHETVQPVIERETIQPTVTHTTVPIKETHHEAPQIHSTTTEAPVSMDEFKRSGNAS